MIANCSKDYTMLTFLDLCNLLSSLQVEYVLTMAAVSNV